jgi:elongation factor 1-alpha
VVVGHKDHGKSTLIGRLLYDSKAIHEQKLQEVRTELEKSGRKDFEFAFLLDSLEEERQGGLTIDIMQMPFKSKKYFYTIIDCPGHREFIKKMFTGASQADASVLVVSAKEGIEDQTKQHAFLIKTLGIRQLVVAVNKMDEANYGEAKFQQMRERLSPILNSLGYANSPVVPLSALRGENVFSKSQKMPWYEGSSLIETLDDNVSPSVAPVNKPLRASVQDIYEIEGTKMIMSKILTGSLEKGKTVNFDPSGEEGLVEKIEMYGKAIETATPGNSVGLILNGLHEAKRGQVISYPQRRAKVVKSFVGELILFSDIELRKNSVLTIRCGTAENKCRVQEILERIDPVNLTVDAKFPEVLKSGDVGKILFLPLEPMCMEKFSEFPELGRFVVEGARGTAAAGIVLETGNRGGELA